MRNFRASAWATICFLAATSIASAQNTSTIDALKIIPADADGFAVIAKLSQLDKKVSALAQRLNLPPASLFDHAKQLANISEGLDRDGSAAAIMYLPENEMPVVIVALPVTNFDMMIKSLDAKEPVDGVHDFQVAGSVDAIIAKKGNFALITQLERRDYLGKVIKSPQNIIEKAKTLERWLKTQDAAAVVLERAVKEGAKKAFETIPEDLPGIPENQAKAVKAQLDWSRNLIKSASEELTHFAIGIAADADSNAKLAFHVGFIKGGSFSKWGEAQPKEMPLAGLPLGGYIFAMGTTLSPESMQKLTTFSASASKEQLDLSEDQVKELQKIMLSSVKGVRGMSFGFQPPAAGGILFEGLVGVIRVDNAKEYLKTYRDSADKANKIMKVDSQSKAVKVGKFDAVESVTDMKSIAKVNDDPNSAQLLEKFFGSAEKVTVTVVAVNANTALIGYVPAAKMKAISESYAKLPMLASAPAVAKTMKLFPSNSFMITLINPKGVLDFVAKTAKDFGHELPIPPLADTAPLGMAAVSDATSFQFLIAVPGDVFTEAGKVVQQHKK